MAIVPFVEDDARQDPCNSPVKGRALHAAAAVTHFGQEIFEGFIPAPDNDSISAVLGLGHPYLNRG